MTWDWRGNQQYLYRLPRIRLPGFLYRWGASNSFWTSSRGWPFFQGLVLSMKIWFRATNFAYIKREVHLSGLDTWFYLLTQKAYFDLEGKNMTPSEEKMRFQKGSITSLLAKVLLLLADGGFGMEEWDANLASELFLLHVLIRQAASTGAHHITGLDGDTIYSGLHCCLLASCGKERYIPVILTSWRICADEFRSLKFMSVRLRDRASLQSLEHTVTMIDVPLFFCKLNCKSIYQSRRWTFWETLYIARFLDKDLSKDFWTRVGSCFGMLDLKNSLSEL